LTLSFRPWGRLSR